MPIPVTQRGHCPNKRCVGQGCRQMVTVGQNAFKVLEHGVHPQEWSKATAPLCEPCARALKTMSADEDAQIVLVEK